MKTAEELLANAPFKIVGIDGELNVSGGYDENFPGASPATIPWAKDMGDPVMPATERIKLADAMLGRWALYRAAATAEITCPKCGRIPSLLCGRELRDLDCPMAGETK